MIICVRIGDDVEVMTDDNTDTRPTPEWLEDSARRVMRTALTGYYALPNVHPVEEG